MSKSKEGVATDYPSVEGHILMRKPENLRVVGQMIGIRVFDMASDGNCFTLSIPHDDKVVKGYGASKTEVEEHMGKSAGRGSSSMRLAGARVDADDQTRYSVSDLGYLHG